MFKVVFYKFSVIFVFCPICILLCCGILCLKAFCWSSEERVRQPETEKRVPNAYFSLNSSPQLSLFDHVNNPTHSQHN
jgi:hypothetical protein